MLLTCNLKYAHTKYNAHFRGCLQGCTNIHFSNRIEYFVLELFGSAFEITVQISFEYLRWMQFLPLPHSPYDSHRCPTKFWNLIRFLCRWPQVCRMRTWQRRSALVASVAVDLSDVGSQSKRWKSSPKSWPGIGTTLREKTNTFFFLTYFTSHATHLRLCNRRACKPVRKRWTPGGVLVSERGERVTVPRTVISTNRFSCPL